MVGVYCIKNLINGRVYIGSSLKIKDRLSSHFWSLKNNKHSNIHLQRAYNINPSYFISGVIEYCNSENRIKLEQFYIDKYISNSYNIRKIAESNSGISPTLETRLKISKAITGKKWTKEQREHFSALKKGYKPSKETIEKIKKTLTGRKLTDKELSAMRRNAEIGRAKMDHHKSKPHSRIQDLNLNKAKGKYGVKVIAYDWSYFDYFETIKEAADTVNLDPSFVAKCVRGVEKSKNYIFLNTPSFAV